jgi:hypothetical protein
MTASVRDRDGQSWQIGDQDTVRWITDATNALPGPTITGAVPAVYEAYATVVIPGDDGPELAAHEAALIHVLRNHTAGGQPWWLGYLETSLDADIIFRDAPRVSLYQHWNYVIVKAGPDQADRWGQLDDGRARTVYGTLPEIIFAEDHAWFVSRLWDNDWRCVGGTPPMIDDLLASRDLDVRQVLDIGHSATPPGHKPR